MYKNMKNEKFKDKNKKLSIKVACHKCGNTNQFINECPLWKNARIKKGTRKLKLHSLKQMSKKL